jgi:hypothetical protein
MVKAIIVISPDYVIYSINQIFSGYCKKPLVKLTNWFTHGITISFTFLIKSESLNLIKTRSEHIE